MSIRRYIRPFFRELLFLALLLLIASMVVPAILRTRKRSARTLMVNEPVCTPSTLSLAVAASEGDNESVKELIYQMVPINYRVNVGEAQSGGFAKDLERLPKGPFDVDGCAPLHFAAAQGHLDVARILLESGAPVNITTEGRETPLVLAARNGQLEMVRLLLSAGARVDLNRAREARFTPRPAPKFKPEIEALFDEAGFRQEAEAIAREQKLKDEGNSPDPFNESRRLWRLADQMKATDPRKAADLYWQAWMLDDCAGLYLKEASNSLLSAGDLAKAEYLAQLTTNSFLGSVDFELFASYFERQGMADRAAFAREQLREQARYSDLRARNARRSNREDDDSLLRLSKAIGVTLLIAIGLRFLFWSARGGHRKRPPESLG